MSKHRKSPRITRLSRRARKEMADLTRQINLDWFFATMRQAKREWEMEAAFIGSAFLRPSTS